MHTVCMHVEFKNIKRSVPATCVKCSVRRYPESGLNGFGLWARLNEWLHGLGPSPSANDLASSFTADVNAAVDHFFPANTVRLYPTDKPALIKQLIKERQQAFHCGDAQFWRLYRRKVQTEIKASKRKFYEEKVRNTLKNDVRQWWRTVNVMSGRTYSQSCFTLERDGVALSEGDLAESLNQYFATAAADITPLDTSCLPSFLPSTEEVTIVHSHLAC